MQFVVVNLHENVVGISWPRSRCRFQRGKNFHVGRMKKPLHWIAWNAWHGLLPLNGLLRSSVKRRTKHTVFRVESMPPYAPFLCGGCSRIEKNPKAVKEPPELNRRSSRPRRSSSEQLPFRRARATMLKSRAGGLSRVDPPVAEAAPMLKSLAGWFFPSTPHKPQCVSAFRQKASRLGS